MDAIRRRGHGGSVVPRSAHTASVGRSSRLRFGAFGASSPRPSDCPSRSGSAGLPVALRGSVRRRFVWRGGWQPVSSSAARPAPGRITTTSRSIVPGHMALARYPRSLTVATSQRPASTLDGAATRAGSRASSSSRPWSKLRAPSIRFEWCARLTRFMVSMRTRSRRQRSGCFARAMREARRWRVIVTLRARISAADELSGSGRTRVATNPRERRRVPEGRVQCGDAGARLAETAGDSPAALHLRCDARQDPGCGRSRGGGRNRRNDRAIADQASLDKDLGLDEEALAAAKQYTFEPGTPRTARPCRSSSPSPGVQAPLRRLARSGLGFVHLEPSRRYTFARI